MAISFAQMKDYFGGDDFTKDLGTLGMYAQGAGALSGAVGNYYNAQAQKNTFATQAELARINSEVAELGRQSTLEQGTRAASRVKMRGSKIKSQQRASQAASGIDLNVGSAKELRVSTDIMKEADADEIMRSSLFKSFGYDWQRESMLNQSRMAAIASDSVSPTRAAVSSLITGAGKVGASWYELQKYGG